MSEIPAHFVGVDRSHDFMGDRQMMDNQVPKPPNSVRLISGPFKAFSYLYNALKGLMTLLVGSTLSQVSPDPHVLPQENLAVLLQPIKHLDRENKLICRISHETLRRPA